MSSSIIRVSKSDMIDNKSLNKIMTHAKKTSRYYLSTFVINKNSKIFHASIYASSYTISCFAENKKSKKANSFYKYSN